MSRRLAALRRSLDAMPSPVEDRPGLLLRDPFGYTEDVVIIPPPLVRFLRFFDGEHEEGDLAEALHRATGELGATGFARRLADTLGGGGFLEDEELERRREARHRAFAEAETREPVHAGEAYPGDVAELAGLLDGWLRPRREDEIAPPGDVYAIAAPHVSPEGGYRSYAAAYRALPEDAAERTVVVLGTSHYGAPERFGLTRKPYVTPFGPAGTDLAGRGSPDRRGRRGRRGRGLLPRGRALDRVPGGVPAAPPRAGRPDRAGPLRPVRARPRTGPAAPRTTPASRASSTPWASSTPAQGSRLLWVLGVDMAHVGRRYGDDLLARAGVGDLAEVEERDRRRIAASPRGTRTASGSRSARTSDDLKWCGAAPLYAFLKATAPRRGALLRYEQWNIDPASVVSFAALAFGRGAAAPPGEGGA